MEELNSGSFYVLLLPKMSKSASSNNPVSTLMLVKSTAAGCRMSVRPWVIHTSKGFSNEGNQTRHCRRFFARGLSGHMSYDQGNQNLLSPQRGTEMSTSWYHLRLPDPHVTRGSPCSLTESSAWRCSNVAMQTMILAMNMSRRSQASKRPPIDLNNTASSYSSFINDGLVYLSQSLSAKTMNLLDSDNSPAWNHATFWRGSVRFTMTKNKKHVAWRLF